MINPKPEHRLTFLEKQFIAMGGHLEGIQEDIENLQQHVDRGFQQAHDFVQERFEEIRTTQDEHTKRLDRIESTMATKDDLARLGSEMKAMEGRLLNAMKQLLQQKSGE